MRKVPQTRRSSESAPRQQVKSCVGPQDGSLIRKKKEKESVLKIQSKEDIEGKQIKHVACKKNDRNIINSKENSNVGKATTNEEKKNVSRSYNQKPSENINSSNRQSLIPTKLRSSSESTANGQRTNRKSRNGGLNISSQNSSITNNHQKDVKALNRPKNEALKGNNNFAADIDIVQTNVKPVINKKRQIIKRTTDESAVVEPNPLDFAQTTKEKPHVSFSDEYNCQQQLQEAAVTLNEQEIIIFPTNKSPYKKIEEMQLDKTQYFPPNFFPYITKDTNIRKSKKS